MRKIYQTNITFKVDYIFGCIGYKKGERNKNIPVEDIERYISRLH